MKTLLRAAIALLSFSFVLRPSPAAAQDIPLKAAESDRPWAKDVPLEQQLAAIALFDEGNALLRDSIFTQAADKYREALRLWDHPAIHYNLALVLFYLDRPLELREHIEAALRLGPEPLGTTNYEKAKTYRGLIDRQLARLKLRCDEPGAQVVMDGRTLFAGPGVWDDRARPGTHSIVVTKPEFFTRELSLTLGGGDVAEHTLKLYKVSDLVRYRRRWPAATPWIVIASGVGVAGLGALFYYAARQNFDAYDATASPNGTTPSDPLDARRTRGDLFQSLAIGSYIAGGVGIASGVVLLYLNRLQPYQEMPPSEPPKALGREGVSWSIAPMVGAGVEGVQGTVRF